MRCQSTHNENIFQLGWYINIKLSVDFRGWVVISVCNTPFLVKFTNSRSTVVGCIQVCKPKITLMLWNQDSNLLIPRNTMGTSKDLLWLQWEYKSEKKTVWIKKNLMKWQTNHTGIEEIDEKRKCMPWSFNDVASASSEYPTKTWSSQRGKQETFNISDFSQDMPSWMFPRHSHPADAYDPYLCSAWHERGAPVLLSPAQVQDVRGNCWLQAGTGTVAAALLLSA